MGADHSLGPWKEAGDSCMGTLDHMEHWNSADQGSDA